MIVLSFDEYGSFESQGNGAVILTGGILYKAADEADRRNEQDRIRAFYSKICSEENADYPQNLHSNDEKSKNVKKKVGSSLGEFFTEGTYKNGTLRNNTNAVIPPREGKYMVYSVIKSERGKTERLQENLGPMERDNYGSNLYFHMATETVRRIVFQNPLLEKNEHFLLEIPTRISEVIDKNSEKNAEFENLNYKNMLNNANDTNNDKAQFYLTNQDVYRAIVEQFLLENNLNGTSVDHLRVEPIKYNDIGDKRYEFMYLADSVCSALSFAGNKKTKDIDRINAVNECAKKLVGAENALVFLYDSVDIDYSRAFEAYQKSNYVEALKIVYDAKLKSEKGGTGIDPYSCFYMENWYGNLLEKIAGAAPDTEHTFEEKKTAFIRAVLELRDVFFSNRYDQNLGLFMLEKLDNLCRLMCDHRPKNNKLDQYIYYFYELYMKAYCHIGDSENAKYYFSKLKKYVYAVNMEEYLRTRHTYVVCLTDAFQWDTARTIAEQDLEYIRKVYELKGQIDEMKGIDCPDELIAYSQLGQVYAAMNDPRAEKCFETALDMYETKDANYYITESYLLHYYLMRGDKRAYEFSASEYFGEHSDLKEQFNFIVKVSKEEHPIISVKYAVFVYLKALYVFYREQIKKDDELWNMIIGLSKTLNWKQTGKDHPYELIFKYIQLLAIEREDMAAKGTYERCMKANDREWEKVNNSYSGISKWGAISPLLVCIQKVAEIEIQKVVEEAKGSEYSQADFEKKIAKKLDEVITILEDCYPAFSHKSSLSIDFRKLSVADQLSVINEKFRYMYS